jgi:BTB/POZ domain
MAWRRGERFDCRYDHTAFYYDEKIFIYGGLTEQMNRSQDLLSLHLPTSTRTLTRIAGPTTPSAGGDGHFYYPITSSPSPVLLDFVMPVFPSSSTSRRKNDASVSALDLHRMHWVILESSPVVRDFVWENLVRGNCDGDGSGKAYFIGYPGGFANDVFSHVLEVDLANFGIVVNQHGLEMGFSPSDDGLGGIATDLATLLDDDESADFSIITDHDPEDDEDTTSESQLADSQITDIYDDPERPVIRCHILILQARWPHFKRIMSSQMSEFHNHKLVLPEPYTVVKSLITYFYTDHLPHLSIPIVSRLLVLANLYNISRLRTLCLGKLLRDLSVDHATIVWAAARESGERGLERRAGKVCFEKWGEVVRTRGFKEMKREDVVELCGLVGRGAKVVDPSAAGSDVGSGSEIDEDGEEEEEEVTENEEMDF